jgi:hypothetical protein
MKKNNKGEDINDLCSVFNSITEFAQYLDGKEETEKFKYMPASRFGTQEFTKTENYDDAHKRLMFGDAELQKKIEEAGVRSTKMNLRKMQNRRVVYPSVVGFAPHVPNYIAGVPTSMINARTKKIRQKVINVFYDFGCAWTEKTETIIKAAAEFVSACMMIEAGGVRLNIYTGRTVMNSEGRKRQYNMLAIKIKESGQQFDTLKMVYPLIHPSMLRRHVCKYMEVTEGLDDFHDGYGRCVINRKEADEVIKKATKAEVILSFDMCKYMTAEDIMKAIEKQ